MAPDAPSPDDPLVTPPACRATGLVQDREILEEIINILADGVILIDQEERVALVNPAMCRLLGLRERELAGIHWTQILNDHSLNDRFNQLLTQALENGQFQDQRTVSYRTPGGQRKEFLLTTCGLSTRCRRGQVTGVLCILSDITQLVELDRRKRELLKRSRHLLEERVQGLDRVARAVAHEVRNPVTSIGGLAQRLLNTYEPDEHQTQYLKRILANSRRLEGMVSQLREFADLPSPNLRPVEMGPWLCQQAAKHANAARAQDVSVECSGADAAPIRAWVDAVLMERALDIMVRNALEAMPEGGRLSLGISSNGLSLVLMVSDTGHGIEPADLPYLFDPFFSTKADAVGMSLALAKRIATEHEGDLKAISRPGKGTTLTMTLPLDDPTPAGPPTPPREPELK